MLKTLKRLMYNRSRNFWKWNRVFYSLQFRFRQNFPSFHALIYIHQRNFFINQIIKFKQRNSLAYLIIEFISYYKSTKQFVPIDAYDYNLCIVQCCFWSTSEIYIDFLSIFTHSPSLWNNQHIIFKKYFLSKNVNSFHGLFVQKYGRIVGLPS